MPTKFPRVKVSFTSNEREHVRQQASRTGLSMSEYIRRLSLGPAPTATGRVSFTPTISPLLALSAKSSVLGSQIKTTLDQADNSLSPEEIGRVDRLLYEITRIQADIDAQVDALLAATRQACKRGAKAEK